MSAKVVVVGLGPGDPAHLTEATIDAITNATVARLRTRVHPSAERFPDVSSYDEWYDDADDFATLYQRIANDVLNLAHTHRTTVVYAVPGSPTVAERTVELLVAQYDVPVTLLPAVSVIDVTCSALRQDPMARGLRVVDALDGDEPFTGPGPLLILQTYRPEILASVSDRLDGDCQVTIVHHLGLDDEEIVTMPARVLGSFTKADHLTALWVDQLDSAGVAIDDLVALTARLRDECAWDRDQTHATLTRHMLEESYEAIDALEHYVALEVDDDRLGAAARHVEEELGDVLFQVLFHAQIGYEDDAFTLRSISRRLIEKLVARHPHVFGDVSITNADDAATQWEELKKKEKSRASVTDGVALQLPSLTLLEKFLRKSRGVGRTSTTGAEALERARQLLAQLEVPATEASDTERNARTEELFGAVIESLSVAARWSGVDLENVARQAALRLRDDIVRHEASALSGQEP